LKNKSVNETKEKKGVKIQELNVRPLELKSYSREDRKKLQMSGTRNVLQKPLEGSELN